MAGAAIPSVLGAQMRPQGPGPDTKRAVVTTFRGEPDAGVKLADEVRSAKSKTILEDISTMAQRAEYYKKFSALVRGP